MFQYIQETERQGTPERDEQGGAFKFLAGYYLKRDLLDEAYEFAIKCTQLADVVEELLAFIIWQILIEFLNIILNCVEYLQMKYLRQEF